MIEVETVGKPTPGPLYPVWRPERVQSVGWVKATSASQNCRCEKEAIFITNLILTFCYLEVRTLEILSYFERLCTNLCCAPRAGIADAMCTWMGLACLIMCWFPAARPEDSSDPLALLAPLLALTMSFGHIAVFSFHMQAIRNMEDRIRLVCITVFSCCCCPKNCVE